MSDIEILINGYQKQIAQLTLENEELKAHVKDFEALAIEWKTGYHDMEKKYRVRLANAEQTVEQLKKELDDVRYGD